MPFRGRVVADRLGRPGPINTGVGITGASGTSPLILSLTGNRVVGSIQDPFQMSKVSAGGGTYALEGTLDSSIRSLTKGLEAVKGSASAGDASGDAALLVEKYLGADVTVNAGHAAVVISKKIGGSGAANARSGGLNIEAIDKIGWAGAGAQTFCEGLHSKSIGGWTGAGRKGSVQAAVLDTVVDSADGPADFGFVNTLEVTTRNKVKDPTARSWATLNGAWPDDLIIPQLIFNYSDSTHPADVGLCIGNGYAEGKLYNGIIIRDGAIQSGGFLFRTTYFTIAGDGHVTMGNATAGADGAFPLSVIEETAGTNDIHIAERRVRRTTGTAAAGMGYGERYDLEDSGGTVRQVAQENLEWIDPAPANRTAKKSFLIFDAGGARNCLTLASDGSNPLVGFHGSAAVSQQSIGAALTPGVAGGAYGATEQAMLQEAHDRARTITAALIACGLMKA